MTEREELIEAMLDAIRDVDSQPDDDATYETFAIAALSALLEQYAVVPRKPTMKMLMRARQAWFDDPERKSSTILRAALEASPIQQGRRP